MNPLQVFIVDELGTPVRSGLEIERAPGDYRALVGESRKVDVRFGMKFRHSCPGAEIDREYQHGGADRH
jgi:hypothetical protein